MLAMKNMDIAMMIMDTVMEITDTAIRIMDTVTEITVTAMRIMGTVTAMENIKRSCRLTLPRLHRHRSCRVSFC